MMFRFMAFSFRAIHQRKGGRGTGKSYLSKRELSMMSGGAGEVPSSAFIIAGLQAKPAA